MLFLTVFQSRWWIVDEIQLTLAEFKVQEKVACIDMGYRHHSQLSRAKATGPIDLVRLAELPRHVFDRMLERFRIRLMHEHEATGGKKTMARAELMRPSAMKERA